MARPRTKRPFNPNRFHYNWHWNWEYGNGDIGNQGVHQMDVARWALRKELPPNVISFGGRFGYEDDGQTPNTQVAFFDYGNAHLLFEVRGLETKPVNDLSLAQSFMARRDSSPSPTRISIMQSRSTPRAASSSASRAAAITSTISSPPC